MMILSQDGCILLNWNKTKGLIVRENRGKHSIYTADDDRIFLGTFGSCEAARQALDKIIKIYEHYGMASYYKIPDDD